jgi:hypothetical protein
MWLATTTIHNFKLNETLTCLVASCTIRYIAREYVSNLPQESIRAYPRSDDAPVKCFRVAPPFENTPVPGPGISSVVTARPVLVNALQAFGSIPVRTYTLFYTLKDALCEIYHHPSWCYWRPVPWP